MKFLAISLALLALPVLAQDPKAYLKSFDSKVYSLKTQGVQDFTVDLVSSRLTKQMNDQMIFGPVKELVFKVYWTASPHRVAIEIQGLPDGFKEIKEELKVSVLTALEDLIPLPLEEKFPNHQFTQGPGMKEITAKDQSGLALVPAYILKFDGQDRLTTIEAQKPVGTFSVVNQYEKTPFSNQKWVLQSQTTSGAENGQSITSTKAFTYSTQEGIGVLTRISVSTEQKWRDAAPLKSQEIVELKNYKINAGEALKYFLAETKK